MEEALLEPVRVAAWTAVAGLQGGVAWLIATAVMRIRDKERKSE